MLSSKQATRLSPLLAVVLAVACADQAGPVQPTGALVANMSIISGEEQSALAGSELPNPLVVRLTDPEGAPVANQIVNFKVTKGGGSVFAGVALTDKDGVAQ